MKIVFKSTVFAIIIALTLVAISTTSVFAAPGYRSNNRNDPGLESKWKTELNALQKYQYLESQVPQWISMWSKTHHSHHQRAEKNRYANQVHLALQQAEIIAQKHAGFDANGKVIDKIQAAQSVQKLATYLHQLRQVFVHKFHH